MTLLDICCGTGTIGQVLASKVDSVIGFEIVESAVQDAKANAARNGQWTSWFRTLLRLLVCVVQPNQIHYFVG